MNRTQQVDGILVCHIYDFYLDIWGWTGAGDVLSVQIYKANGVIVVEPACVLQPSKLKQTKLTIDSCTKLRVADVVCW